MVVTRRVITAVMAALATAPNSVQAQFKPGSKNEEISAGGKHQTLCGPSDTDMGAGVALASSQELDASIKYFSGVRFPLIVPEAGCINLRVGCRSRGPWHDSTVALCNMNTDRGHTISLAEEEFPEVVVPDLVEIRCLCGAKNDIDMSTPRPQRRLRRYREPSIGDKGISGKVIHTSQVGNSTWAVVFGSVGPGCSHADPLVEEQ